MTKTERREIETLAQMHKLGMADTVARGLSALIRCARTKTSRADLLEYAALFGVSAHSEFII